MAKRGQNEGSIFGERPGRWAALLAVGYWQLARESIRSRSIRALPSSGGTPFWRILLRCWWIMRFWRRRPPTTRWS
jgi:hypothetical protein